MECELFNVIVEVWRVEWGGRVSSGKIEHHQACRAHNGTKDEDNIVPPVGVPMWKAVIAITKRSQTLHLPRQMTFHTRRIFTKCGMQLHGPICNGGSPPNNNRERVLHHRSVLAFDAGQGWVGCLHVTLASVFSCVVPCQ